MAALTASDPFTVDELLNVWVFFSLFPPSCEEKELKWLKQEWTVDTECLV